MAQPEAQPTASPAIDLDLSVPAILTAAAAEAAQLAPALCVEIARAHVLTMQLTTAAKAAFDRIEPGRPSPASRRARRCAEGSGQAMDSVRLGALALQRLDTIGRPRQQRRAARPPMPATTSLPAERRGRLKNGNPAGDYLAAPRCGARTRCGGCCRQPAMANGRCRMHGGESTGPRTARGLSASRRARVTRGDRSVAALAIGAVTNAARSLARLQRVQARVAPLLAETQELPSTPCPAESTPAGESSARGSTHPSKRVPLSRETGEEVGVRVRVAARLHPSHGTALTPALSRRAGEGNAPADAHRNPSHLPSTPCQAGSAPAGGDLSDDQGAGLAGVEATGSSGLTRGSPLQAHPSAQAGEGNAPSCTACNSPRLPSTPCQAEDAPRHSFPWLHRPAPPMVRPSPR